MTNTQRAIRAWIEENPLRRWRRETNTTIMQAAVRMGVTITTIQKWEFGGMRPGPENLARMAGAMGQQEEALADAWDSWLSRRPQE